MRVIILGSGSTGNALYVESGDTRVLIDAGLSGKETARRMTEVGLNPSRLDAIVISHEHVDHVKGLQTISKSTDAPVFVSNQTRNVVALPQGGEDLQWGDQISSGQAFQIGPLEFHPFPIPHDGVDTVAFTVVSKGVKIGLVTDLGYITKLVAEHLKDCDLVIVEANHDLEMLRTGPYPWSVKQRIASRTGHLSNDEMARWLRDDFDGKAEYIVLAHLSRHCNHPEIARLAALKSLDYRGSLFFQNAEDRVRVASAEQPSEWFEF